MDKNQEPLASGRRSQSSSNRITCTILFKQLSMHCQWKKIKGSRIVVSGDGRYFSEEAIQIIIKMTEAIF